MPDAYSILPDRFEDGRHAALLKGLAANGFHVKQHNPRDWHAGDVLISWTRHRGPKDDLCHAFEKRGGRVIVAEEPHLKGRFPPTGERLYALSLSDHQARWRAGGPERWQGFGVALKPWREGPGVVLVREQRGIGSALMASPADWHNATAVALKKITSRPVAIRPHPKNVSRGGGKPVPLSDMRPAVASLVTWSSHDGAEALIEGIPVIWRAPHGFVRDACGTRLEQVDDPPRPERMPVFERMAWAHWRTSEIENGEAFAWLLG